MKVSDEFYHAFCHSGSLVISCQYCGRTVNQCEVSPCTETRHASGQTFVNPPTTARTVAKPATDRLSLRNPLIFAGFR